ncbi:MAG: protein kinase [Phycisphaerae bacterium]
MDLADIGVRPAQADGHGEPSPAGYRVLALLRTSGQGRVYQAICLADARKVAVKLIRPDRLGDPQARARFAQEARTLALLSHPGIVRVVDSGELADGQLWFAAEYISGLSLNEYVNKLDGRAIEAGGSRGAGVFPLHEVLEIFVQICDAVQAAHNVGVLHRDLKPSNILVDDDGRPHVLDFGLAKAPEVSDPALVTLTGQFLGSPAWCSPEQVEARPSAIDVRSDVYSLGVILYNALTGTFPYPLDGPLADVFDAIRHTEPARPSAHATFIDDDLDTIILKALAKAKERRYQSAGELRDEVQRYLRGEPIRAKGDGWAYVAAKFLRRHPVVTGIAAAVFVLSLGYGGAMTVLYRRAVSAEAKATAHSEDARQKFRLAKQTAESMLSQVDEVLSKTAGMNNVRQKLLAQLSSQFEALTREHGDDPALEKDLATAHSRLADVYQSISDIERAAKHVEAALAVRERLATASPRDADAQSALSIALVRVGDIASLNGQLEKRRELYERAFHIDEALVETNPGNSNYRDNLSWSYNRLAHLARQRGDDELADDLLGKRRRIAEDLWRADPDNPARMSTLLDSYEQFKVFELGQARRANELADRLMAIDPANVDYERHFVISRNLLSSALHLGHMDDEAVAPATEGLEVTRRMIRAAPNEVVPRALLFCCFNRGCDQAEHRRDWTLLSEFAREILDSNNTLVEIQQGAAEGRYYNYASHYRLAHAAWVCGEPEEARTHMATALAMAKQLADDKSVTTDRLWELSQAVFEATPAEYSDPKLALQYAERAAAASTRPGPEKLELLRSLRDIAARP